ncbi:MAG: ECF transporter S component [Eubacteriales bacterium]|nr:ECF transporter S component [Eubacteriales bacterium]
MLNKDKIRAITTSAVLSGLSLAMVVLLHTSVFAAAPFLEYDPADVPILIGGMTLGPIWGLAITLVVSAVQALTVSAQSGLYGFLMHMIASGTLVLTFTLVHRNLKAQGTVKIIAAVFFSTVTSTTVMAGANLLITPYFMGVSVSAVKEMLLPVIIPFNLIKLGGNSVITAIIYKSLERFIKQYYNPDKKCKKLM